MIFKVITLFPDFFPSPLRTGLLGKAIDAEKLKVNIVDLRAYSEDKFNRCDDYPYGGGAGMVLMADPFFKAIEEHKSEKTKVIIPSPCGRQLDQDVVKALSGHEDLCILCGHYEGIDQRVIDTYADYEISIGDYILSGGEFAALVIIDTIARYVPGFMSNEASVYEESFEMDLLEYPHYTRPAVYNNQNVPDVLLSGNHKQVEKWRVEQQVERTKRVRPDLYKKFIKRKLLQETQHEYITGN